MIAPCVSGTQGISSLRLQSTPFTLCVHNSVYMRPQLLSAPDYGILQIIMVSRCFDIVHSVGGDCPHLPREIYACIYASLLWYVLF